MAITFNYVSNNTTVQALGSLLNGNYDIIKDTMNKLLNVIDISTGNINNSTFASGNSTTTANLTSTGLIGVTINLGNLTVSTGNVKLTGTSSRLEIGTTIKLERISKNLTVGTTDVLDLSGTSGALTGDGTISGIVLPRMNVGTILDITNPIEGLLVWDTTNKVVKVYDGTSWVNLLV